MTRRIRSTENLPTALKEYQWYTVIILPVAGKGHFCSVASLTIDQMERSGRANTCSENFHTRNIDSWHVFSVHDGGCVAMSNTVMDPDSSLNEGNSFSSLSQSLSKTEPLSWAFMSDLDSSISTYKLSPQFMASKKSILNLPIYSFPSGRPNS